MTSRESARKYWKELKGKPLKQKLEHIVTYYGFALVIIIALIATAASYIVHVASQKDAALNVICLGAKSMDDKIEQMEKDFAQHAGIDLDEFEVQISTNMLAANGNLTDSYQAGEVVMTMIAVQEMDLMAADAELMVRYYYSDYFADLRQVLSAQQQQRYGDSYLYVDMAVVELIAELVDQQDIPPFPDPTKPEEMEKPVPVAIMLRDDSEFYKQCFPHCKKGVALAIPANSKNLTNALLFLDYVMG